MTFHSELRQLTWQVLNIGFHISEKELIRGKMWVFLILEPARLLGACSASQARGLIWILEQGIVKSPFLFFL